jgi:hypothetical protein
MRTRFFGPILTLSAVLGILTLTPGAAQTPARDPSKPAEAAWNPPRLPDGQPDVQGMWITKVNAVFILTQGVGPDDELPRADGRPAAPGPSRVVDPPDHLIPYQPWAKEKQLHLQAKKNDPSEEEFVDPQVRCLPGGPVRPAFWQDFQLLQYPGYVVFEYEGNHVFRIIPLDGRPHAGSSLKLWMGDSRGHWEGTTLVVDVTNNNSKGRLSRQGDFASDNLHVTERYTFMDGKNMRYEATFDDPTVYTKPWKVGADFIPKRTPPGGYEQWEEACHEGEHDAALAGANLRPAK